MQLYDTAAQTTLPLEVRNGRIGLYVCGITPYDGGHLGHAFTYHTFDILVRRLRHAGVMVRSVRNVTDVDDDIFRVSRERHIDHRALIEQQVSHFDRDMADLGLLPVDVAPHASAHVPLMVAWIDRLIDHQVAYAVDGWVYFEVAAFARYGQLSHLEPARMLQLSGERGANPDDPRKRAPLDFVLWQPSLPDEPRWASPWSHGRPGWHIECTVLSATELDTPIDVHGGGDDLIYPHHESEIAQAEAVDPTPYVRHWMHVAMVRHQGEKMSKSLGNLVFVRQLLDAFPAATVRLLLCAHHHREAWSYHESELAAADTRRLRYTRAMSGGARLDSVTATGLRAEFLARLDDDLDTPGALRVLDAIAERVENAAHAPLTHGTSAGQVMDELLGLLGARVQATVP